MTAITDDLRTLEAAYAAAGHQFWLVGGWTRDQVLGLESKDVDIATSATPEEQVEICERAGFRWFGTGLKHGTLTILAGGEPYEITSFRTDVETDGRHATVAYSRDLLVDLARRDLTINAIAQSLDGEVVDPFGGVADALAGRVRFVGEASDRIREDYLRILRWFRFVGRFASTIVEDGPEAKAIAANAQGLSRISVERVWSETRRILSGRQADRVVMLMADLGVLDVLGIARHDAARLAAAADHTDDPAVLLAAWLGEDAVEVADRWKASGDERATVVFAAPRIVRPYGRDEARLDLVDGAAVAVVAAILRTQGLHEVADEIEAWTVPVFPVKGRDLLDDGMKPGPAVGEAIRRMREAWVASDYVLDADELKAMAPA
jgi:tRNA nucleotidyltransferase/poly(A) polymerase